MRGRDREGGINLRKGAKHSKVTRSKMVWMI